MDSQIVFESGLCQGLKPGVQVFSQKWNQKGKDEIMMMQPSILPTRRIRGCGRKEQDRARGLRLTHEQAASDLEGPGTPSHGQLQSQAVDKKDVIVGVWINIESTSLIELNEGR